MGCRICTAKRQALDILCNMFCVPSPTPLSRQKIACAKGHGVRPTFHFPGGHTGYLVNSGVHRVGS